jgi:type IV secretory pathway VirB2 component (pilin)
MKTTFTRAATVVLLAALFALQTAPAFAQFTGAATQATSWVVQLLTPLFPLAVAVVGFLSLTGRINWGWFAAAVIGCALFFGRDQVVSMIRGWVGA